MVTRSCVDYYLQIKNTLLVSQQAVIVSVLLVADSNHFLLTVIIFQTSDHDFGYSELEEPFQAQRIVALFCV